MTTSQTIILRRMANTLAELAERLDNMNIGVQPITKRDAAAALYAQRAILHQLTDGQEHA
jgi:hypothetical protein